MPLLVSLAVILVLSRHLIVDGDPLWQLATGRWIVLHRAFPWVDPFSWTVRGRPLVEQEWGYTLLSYFLVRAMGYWGLMLLTWAGLAGMLVFLWLLCRREGKSGLVTVAVFMLASLFPGAFIMARPQMASYFFFALFLYILAWRTDRRWLLPALALVWANLHASVLLGVVMVAFEALLLLVMERDRSLLPVAAATFLASLANPFGLGLWRFTLWLSTNPWLRHIDEWQAPNFATSILYPYLVIFVSLGVALFYHQAKFPDRRAKRKLLTLAAYVAAFSFQAVTCVRYLPYLDIVWAAALLHLVPDGFLAAFRARRIAGAMALLALVAVGRGLLHFPPRAMDANLDGRATPVAAVRYIKAHGLTDRLFNFYAWGGYLIYERVPVFVDGRTDLYLGNGRVFEDYVRVTTLGVKPDTVLRKYGIRTVLLPRDAALTRYLEAEPARWEVVYRGPVGEVFVARQSPRR